MLRPGAETIARARRAPRLHAMAARDAHGLGRLPGLLPRRQRRPSDVPLGGGRRGRLHVQVPPRRVHAHADSRRGRPRPGSPRRGRPDAARRVPARRRRSRRRRAGRRADHALGEARARDADDPSGRRSSASCRARASRICAALTPTSWAPCPSTASRSGASRSASPSTACTRRSSQIAPALDAGAAPLPDGSRHTARSASSRSARASTCSTASSPPATRETARRSRAAARSSIKQARWHDDPRPIDEACSCACCAGGYSRGVPRHLYLAGEILVSAPPLPAQPSLLRRADARRPRRPSSEGRYSAWATPARWRRSSQE